MFEAIAAGTEQHVRTGREPDCADPVRVDVVAGLEERERARDVLRPVPAVVVLAAVALAAAAGVVEQDAVAVTCEQLGVGDRALAVAAAAVDDDDRGAEKLRRVAAPTLPTNARPVLIPM